MPVPVVRKEIVHCPKFIPQKRIQHEMIEEIIEMPVPMVREEI